MPDYNEFNIRPKVPSQRGYKVLDGAKYDVWIRYISRTEKWLIDLVSITDPSVAIKGKALLQGKDLIAPHGYKHILGQLWVEDTAGTNEDPTYDGMGDRWRLRYYPRTE